MKIACVFTDLKIFGKAISVILLVEPLGIQGASHLQHLQVSFQLLGDLGGFHIKPTISCCFLPLHLVKTVISMIYKALKKHLKHKIGIT